MTALLILLAVLPALALVVYFYLRDRYEPEPRSYVVLAFMLGVASVLPILYLGPWLQGLVSLEWRIAMGAHHRLYDDFIVAAALEEGVKWLVLVGGILWWHEFDEPMDGCVYGATLALGLAAIENIFYVTRIGTFQIALLRGVYAVPTHALCGATMGYFLGRAKFSLHRWKWSYLVPASLAVPWLFHGAYDHLCGRVGQGKTSGWVILSVFSLGMWVFVLVAVQWALGRSPFKTDEGSAPDDDHDGDGESAPA